jgi:ankyrin repeat protein
MHLTRHIGWIAAALVVAVGWTVSGREGALVEAARAADLDAVRALVADRVDVNAPSADGTTALHWAAQHEDLRMAGLLLDAGARAQAANRYGVTPLYLAATNGNAALIERLIDAGADPNTALPEGETALMTAARTGTVDAVKVLLARGALVDGREGWRGQTALMWAAAENNAEVIPVLADAGADVRARSAAGSFTPFLFAVRAGHVDAARALLDVGADINAPLPDGMSPLVLAVFNAHYELAAFLLDRGADPNADAQGWTALHQVAWSRRPNRGFNLPGAAPTGNLDSLDLVRRLVARGANVNARQTKEPRDGNRNMLDRIGSTPFLQAAKTADVPLMRVLLDSGADPSIPTENGTTALMVAAGVGIWAPGESPGTHDEALAAVRLALEAGGGAVNDVDHNGETALHGAVYRGGAVSIIRFLADRGARLDPVNAKGWTPLVAAEGVEYTPNVLKRYPEAAALLRQLMRARGLDVSTAGAGSTAAEPPAVTTSTIWNGVFTAAQATRGAQVYRGACAVCHLDDLSGDAVAPPLTGDEFTSRWEGTTAHDMVTTVRRSMPEDAPDSLGDQRYVDLISYLLQANGSPAGVAELPVDPAALRRILITGQTR